MSNDVAWAVVIVLYAVMTFAGLWFTRDKIKNWFRENKGNRSGIDGL